MSRPTSPIFELLDTDGGWLTAAGIAHELSGADERNIERSLYRWRAKGYVEDRVVGLALAVRETPTTAHWARGSIARRARTESRHEWRTTA